ncbi:MAG: virulence factor BrkB family protein [Corallincola sp.]|nr:virulence factor BrkB family protein [Corallincola sp.]
MGKLIALLQLQLAPVRALLAELLPQLWQRWHQDKVTVTAGYLAYITLLSLVPLVAVAFGLLSAFPVFAEGKALLEAFIFTNLVPTAGDTVHQYLLGFVSNANRMTTVGVISLIVVALLLISNIDVTLNHLWRVPKRRRFLASFPVYWMVLTLGPLLTGSSLVLTSYLLAQGAQAGEVLSSLSLQLLRVLPFVLSVAAFFILYTVVPNVRVRYHHALWGALVAALLFEASKKGFAYYITQFPSYEAIYGALATIPILFVWIYLAWLIVLSGALLTATLGDIRPRPAAETVADGDEETRP